MTCPTGSAVAAGALSANTTNMTGTISGPNYARGPRSHARDQIPMAQSAPPHAHLACESCLFGRVL